MTTEDHIRALREALAAGPTPGPWRYWSGSTSIWGGGDPGRAVCIVTGARKHADPAREANAALIAAANPAAILAVLDALEAAQMDAERLRVALLQAAAANAWQNFGESRAFHSFGHQERISTPDEIDALARAALTPGA